ncbi:hypothetical protein [Actinoallomurus acaciae]|uniref:Uncharacterized protein n=1 Tax=Actinoallomurus acaciae TaxID=502577 RepID=A0ABV5YCV1_9ACTN
MSVVNEALAFLGITSGSTSRGGPAPDAARTREEQRRIAAAMRALPGRFADRLPRHALERINNAAAEGRWEESLDDLLTGLHARGEAITGAERDDLSAVLAALQLPSGRLETLLER